MARSRYIYIVMEFGCVKAVFTVKHELSQWWFVQDHTSTLTAFRWRAGVGYGKYSGGEYAGNIISEEL